MKKHLKQRGYFIQCIRQAEKEEEGPEPETGEEPETTTGAETGERAARANRQRDPVFQALMQKQRRRG